VVSDIPPYLTPAKAINITAELHNKNKKISKNSFLRFVEFGLTHINENDIENQLELIHTNVREDKGQYLHLFEETLAEGKHSFIVTVDSRTFDRKKRIDVVVQWPVKVEIKSTTEPGTYRLTVQAREEYLKPDTLLVNVQLKAPDGEQLALKLNNISNVWEAEVSTNQAGLYQALIETSAQSVNGEKLEYDLGAFSMVGVYQPESAEIEIEPEPEPIELESDLDDRADADSIEAEASIPEEKTNWTQIMIIVGATNLTLILIIGGLYLMYRRSSKKTEFSLDDELNDDTKPKEAESFNV
jgi:uncharacterized protein (TIGR03503 family)